MERGDSKYVFNGLSGALLRVPKNDFEAVQRFLADDEGADCSPSILEQLVQGRMLIQESNDELALLALRYKASRQNNARFSLTIVTSLGCNFDCPYCFEAKHPSIMKEEVRALVLEALDDQLPKINSFYVTWYGGEPLVGKKPLLDLSDAFIERCDLAQVTYNSSIITNGYLLDEETCAQLRDRRVAFAQITLDGPPEVHDTMRPLVNGKGTFWDIVKNLNHAVNYLDIEIRMNVDKENFQHAERLMQILEAEGLVGKLRVYPGQIVKINDGAPAPSATYQPTCFTNPEFAQIKLEFEALSERYGFYQRSLPSPTGAPCTAVRKNELVVGSNGELYKCWDSVGNQGEVIGHIRDYKNLNGRLAKWLKYDPFSNDECRGCIALPVCMGGCAHHAFDPLEYDNRCGAFRHTYQEQVLKFVELAEETGLQGLAPAAQLAQSVETR